MRTTVGWSGTNSIGSAAPRTPPACVFPEGGRRELREGEGDAAGMGSRANAGYVFQAGPWSAACGRRGGRGGETASPMRSHSWSATTFTSCWSGVTPEVTCAEYE